MVVDPAYLDMLVFVNKLAMIKYQMLAYSFNPKQIHNNDPV